MDESRQRVRSFLREPALPLLTAGFSLLGCLLPLVGTAEAVTPAGCRWFFLAWGLTVGVLFALSRALRFGNGPGGARDE